MPIRSATLADLPALIALEQSSPTAAHWSAEQYRTLLAGAGTHVALVTAENSVILGFLMAREVAKEWELENIVISAVAQRRGLATQLLDEFLNTVRSRHGNAIFLEVRNSNQPARRLYEKHGFLVAGRRPRYYHDPEEDAVLYRLALI